MDETALSVVEMRAELRRLRDLLAQFAMVDTGRSSVAHEIGMMPDWRDRTDCPELQAKLLEWSHMMAALVRERDALIRRLDGGPVVLNISAEAFRLPPSAAP